jgi:hypothetical protein
MIEFMVQGARSMIHFDPAAWPVLLLLALLGPLAWWVAGAVGGSRWLAVAAAACLAVAVTLTVARPGLRGADPDWSRFPSACTITDARPLTLEALLNLFLLVPFVTLAVLAVGHPVPVAVLAIGVSVGVETIQALYATGSCDSSDVLRNSAGALVAAVVAAALRLGATAPLQAKPQVEHPVLAGRSR